MCDYYNALYDIHHDVETGPLPYVIETVKKLNDAGAVVGVISNKPDLAVKACIQEHFGNIFIFAEGSSEKMPMKPSPDVFTVLAKQYGIDKTSTLYVGDMLYDVEFAANVGMDLAMCLHEYGQMDVKKRGNYLIKDFRDLLVINAIEGV